MVISKAGDTDTNACIVGGLLGSIFGFKGLPNEYKDKLSRLRFNEVRKMKRKSFYEPINGIRMLYNLYEKCYKQN
jgi:ADP-ribosylglycohydrolase